MGGEVQITPRDAGRARGLPSGQPMLVRAKTRFFADVLEMEDVNFHHNSAVLLPDYGSQAPQPGTAAQNRITGLGVLCVCYNQADTHHEQKLLLAGHTDRSGPDWYNLDLSRWRAENVLHALMGNRDEWVRTAQIKKKVEDEQQILKWVSYNFGWDCDPGTVDDQDNPATREALRKFQTRYKPEFDPTFTVTGVMDPATWGAFFDLYMKELKLALGTDDAGLAALRARMFFLNDGMPFVGCGENFPKTKQQKSPVDRRVEFLFFDPGEEPLLECHPRPGVCRHRRCDMYGALSLYKFTPIPVNPPPRPSGEVCRVFLKLQYNDPEGNARPMPANFPVTIVEGDGTTRQVAVGTEGNLNFEVERPKRTFTLRFDTAEDRFIASPTSETTGPAEERFLEAPDVPAAIADHYRVFRLPRQWSLANTDWAVVGAAPNYTKPDFTGLDTPGQNIGSNVSRVTVTLNPHWQFLKFLYFDRWLKQKMSVPAIMVEGFVAASSLAGPPDTLSNWTVPAQGLQCLPWILQNPPKPDNSVVLRLRTAPNTFIESSGDSTSPTRRLVTVGAASAATSNDLGVTRGGSTSFDMASPAMDRLKYYDLPALWRSQRYFVTRGSGTASSPPPSGWAEDHLGDTTSAAEPLIFSLDDMVLTDALAQPLSWVPDDQLQNRIAVFCNAFAASGPSQDNLSHVGLYKPDGEALIGDGSVHAFTSNHRPSFTQRSSAITNRNYIADYPDWTRIVLMGGNVFDVFDRRTAESAVNAVGARAAVRWVESASVAVPNTTLSSRPALTSTSPFCVIQPFYGQDQPWGKANTTIIGRYELVMLRCCDVDTANSKEVAVLLSYVRYFFNFNASFTPSFNPHGVALACTEANGREWAERAIRNLLSRWNGPSGYSDYPFEIFQGSTGGGALKVRALWIAQSLPENISHFEIGVFRETVANEKIRAYMNSGLGRGALDMVDNAMYSAPAEMVGWFTFAHENGHGESLADEYAELTSPAGSIGAWLPGFDCNTPGSPYIEDVTAMMKENKYVRGRYFWHLAEWTYRLYSSTQEMIVRKGSTTYKIPHHSQANHTHVTWPVGQVLDKTLGNHGKFDLFFYPLGIDEFSKTVLPNLCGGPANPFDGIFVVLVKMKFDFDTSDNTIIHARLTDLNSAVRLYFNFKFAVHGHVGGRNYTKALLYFAPRYWVQGYSNKQPDDNAQHFDIDVPESGIGAWDGGVIVHRELLEFPRTRMASEFVDYFGQMVGIASAHAAVVTDYQPLVRDIMSDAVVYHL